VDVKPVIKKTEITYEELSKLVAAGTLHLFDVREPADVNETGIIKSAVNVPCMINLFFNVILNHHSVNMVIAVIFLETASLCQVTL